MHHQAGFFKERQKNRWIASILITSFLVLSACSELFNSGSEKLFRLISERDSGIDFSNTIIESQEFNIINYQDFYSGGGVSIGDINNDGLADIFFTGNMVQNRLYLNMSNLRFEDITVTAGLTERDYTWTTGSTMIDINNDGWLDIYVCYSGLVAPEQRKNKLWINQHNNTFLDKAAEYGLDHAGYAVNAHFFDYDKDGDVDIYLVNQGPEKNANFNMTVSRDEYNEYCGDKLFRNDNGKYVNVTTEASIYSPLINFGHGAATGDLNDDGWDDIYVSNDFFEQDYLYINNQDGTFTEVLKKSMPHISNFSMGNDMADFNNDGLLDIVTVDMVAEDHQRQKAMESGMNRQLFWRAYNQGYHYQYMYNMLQMNNDNTTFSEIAHLAGISNTDWSWGPLFADFDGDGFKDLFISNGLRKDIRNRDWAKRYNMALDEYGSYELFPFSIWKELLESLPSEKLPNYIYRNSGDLTFENVTEKWGLDRPTFSNGAAYGDLDNDGDLDLVVNNVDDEAFLYENTASQNTNYHYLKIKLKGPESNLMALGTKVVIHTGSTTQTYQEYIARGYRSSMDPAIIIGCGADTLVDRLNIFWPDGTMTAFENVSTNQELVIDYNASTKAEIVSMPKRQLLFESDNSDHGVSFVHKENNYDPYQIQPLLPYRLSELGPPLEVADVNNDGLDDFFIGGAYGQVGSLYVQKSGGLFEPSNVMLFDQDKLYEDTGATFIDVDNDGDKDLVVVSGGYEFDEKSEVYQDRLYLNDGAGIFQKSPDRLPRDFQSGGKVIAADWDKDGDEDLLILGRQVPQKYPLQASTRMLNNEDGYFKDVTLHYAPELQDLGMATDATFADIDNDNDSDLVVVGEWMNITLFENDGGAFKKSTSNNGLQSSAGWWNCIYKVDIDADGDDDFIVGNLGLNSKYKATRENPLEVFTSDINNDQRQDIIFAFHSNGKILPLDNLERSIAQFPELADRIPSNEQFSRATLYDIYTKNELESASHFQVQNFGSSVVINKGEGNFVVQELPRAAQISSVMAVLAADYDSDGREDVLIAGNRYGIEEETVRNDAGIGLLLTGNDLGGIVPRTFVQTGLYLAGDVNNIQYITVDSKPYIIVSRVNGPISFTKINKVSLDNK